MKLNTIERKRFRIMHLSVLTVGICKIELGQKWQVNLAAQLGDWSLNNSKLAVVTLKYLIVKVQIYLNLKQAQQVINRKHNKCLWTMSLWWIQTCDQNQVCEASEVREKKEMIENKVENSGEKISYIKLKM